MENGSSLRFGVEMVAPLTAAARRSGELLGRALLPALTGATAAVIWLGWLHRNDGLLTPEEGAGYVFGLIGTAMMLALIGYPLRKRIRAMRRWGPLKLWFRAHMLLGLVGPILILFHANFRTGSRNSTIAMGAMILVAVSGVVGRYLYARIHDGLYGRRLRLSDLRQRLEREDDRLAIVVHAVPGMAEQLQAFERRALSDPRNVLHGVARILAAGTSTRWTRFVLRRRARRGLARLAGVAGWDGSRLRRERRELVDFIDGYLSGVRRVVEFGFYERIFAAWHVFHVPLFFLLCFAAALHVIAVHRF